MAGRIRRKRISKEDREMLAHAFEEPDEDYLEMADTLRIIHYDVCGQKKCHITNFWAFSPVYGVTYHSIHIGRMTRDRFNQFLQSPPNLLDENAFHFLFLTVLHFIYR